MIEIEDAPSPPTVIDSVLITNFQSTSQSLEQLDKANMKPVPFGDSHVSPKNMNRKLNYYWNLTQIMNKNHYMDLLMDVHHLGIKEDGLERRRCNSSRERFARNNLTTERSRNRSQQRVMIVIMNAVVIMSLFETEIVI